VSPAAILFDAGNTLVFLDYARLAGAVGAAMGVPLTAHALAAAAPRAALAMEQGHLRTDRERGAAFLLSLFEQVGVGPERMEELREVLLRLHLERHLWASSDGRVAGALARLRDAGFRLGVVSNSDGRAASALEACGLLDFFEVVIDSGAVGVEKPDPRIFALALDRMGLAPGEALYVGDLYEVDVVGARAAGLEVVLLDPTGLHGHRDVRTAPDVVALAEMLLAPHPTP
jgi:putative hydrolase of the HAD superfamily